MDIYTMDSSHELWNDVISFAERSDWSAGPYLAGMMREERFLEWERVFAAFESGEPIGYCNLTQYDEMPPESGFSPFIGFVYVDKEHRGNRISEKLIRRAIEYAGALGYDAVYLMSGEQGLYEKYGFEKLGDHKTVFGGTDRLFRFSIDK